MNIRRKVSGYVLIYATGSGVGRFFNLCVKNNIPLWNVRALGGDQYRFFVARKDVWSMRPYLTKTRTRVRIAEKHGFVFLLFRYRRRIIFPIALAAVSLLFGYASRFVWKIEVHGNSYLTEDMLISYLKTRDAAFGSKIADIDCETLELSLRQDFAQVIWASVSIEGTDLIVELQEKVALPETGDTGESASAKASSAEMDDKGGSEESVDLVASEDAVIESIITRSGTPKVKAGDTVEKGTVLVAGRQDILGDDESVMLSVDGSADADVMGKVTYPYKDQIPRKEIVKIRGSQKLTEIAFSFGDKSLRLPVAIDNYEDSESVEEYHQLHLTDQFYLPLGIQLRRSCELTEETRELSEQEALQRAQEHLAHYRSDLEESGVTITEENVTMQLVKDTYRIKGTLTGLADIGVPRGARERNKTANEY